MIQVSVIYINDSSIRLVGMVSVLQRVFVECVAFICVIYDDIKSFRMTVVRVCMYVCLFSFTVRSICMKHCNEGG